jgi:hypothetical protein
MARKGVLRIVGELLRPTLRSVLDARTYMLALPTDREHRTQWQRAAELLLAEADVTALSKQIGLALSYDGRLVLT